MKNNMDITRSKNFPIQIRCFDDCIRSMNVTQTMGRIFRSKDSTVPIIHFYDHDDIIRKHWFEVRKWYGK